MTTISLANLRARVRLHADFPNADQGKLDADVNILINDACAEYYDLLVSMRGQEYYQTDETLSVTSGSATYSLPEDLYQLISVIAEWSTDDHEAIKALPTEASTTTYTNSATWERWGPKGYRIRSGQSGTAFMTFFPTPRSTVTVRLRYVPAFVPLANDSDTLDCVNAWWTLIVFRASSQLRGLLGLPNDHLRGELAQQLERVQTMATERLADDPSEIIDVDTSNMNWRPPPRWNSAT